VIDSYERRVFLEMLGRDEDVVAAGQMPSFGSRGWAWFLTERSFFARRTRRICGCGFTCPGPFLEMHICPDGAE